MNPTWETELATLITAAIEDDATSAQLQRLGLLLAEYPAARAAYVELMAVHSILRWRSGLEGRPENICSLANSELANPELADLGSEKGTHSSHETSPDASASPPPSPVLGFLGGVVDYVSHSRRLMFLLVAAMLSGWFVFQIGSVLLGRLFTAKDQVAAQGEQHPGAAGPKPPGSSLAGGSERSHGAALAWLSGSVSGRWQVVGANPATGNSATGNSAAGNSAAGNSSTGNPAEPAFWEVGTEFTAAQQVKLVAGLGEITFCSGAKVVLTAPAQFSIASALGVDLQMGKLAARVPHDPMHPGATGFTVSTPAGNVVDLGTEFGVEVTPDRKMDVQVFVGAVKVKTLAGGGDLAGVDGVRVAAGQLLHVAPGQPAAIVESKESRFHRDLELTDDFSDKATADYLDFVRRLKPAVWFRMEGKDTERTIRDEMGHAAEGKLQWDGPGNPFVSGAVGKSLWLRGPMLRDCAMIPDYPKAEHDKLSVSAWVFADSRPNWAMIAANWGDSVHGQFHFSLSSEDTNDGLDLRIEISQRDGKDITLREGATHPFPLNEWQHVAFVADGTTLRLYREGREVGSLSYDGLLFPVPLPSLGIGAKTDNSGTTINQQVPANWSGKLDEIAIFNDALTPGQIKKLAAAPPR